jgi:hypothetical protein
VVLSFEFWVLGWRRHSLARTIGYSKQSFCGGVDPLEGSFAFWVGAAIR